MESLFRRLGAAGLLIAVALSSPAKAAVIAESEPNDTLATAQNVNGFFTLDFDANIGDRTGNTSTWMPHVTIMGTGNDTVDYFGFTITTPSLVILDVDCGAGCGPLGQDLAIALWSGDGTLLAYNDDDFGIPGAGGSSDAYDPYLDFTNFGLLQPGTYVVGVAAWHTDAVFGGWFVDHPGDGVWGPADEVPGTDYALHISRRRVDEPAAIGLLGLGLICMGAVRRRRLRK